MLRRTPAALCFVLATLFHVATPFASYASLEGPEPAFLGVITKNAERDTFGYDLLDDPDLVGAGPEFTAETAYLGPVFADEEKNSWAYRMREAAHK